MDFLGVLNVALGAVSNAVPCLVRCETGDSLLESERELFLRFLPDCLVSILSVQNSRQIRNVYVTKPRRGSVVVGQNRSRYRSINKDAVESSPIGIEVHCYRSQHKQTEWGPCRQQAPFACLP